MLLFVARGEQPDPAISVWATWQTFSLFCLLIASCMIGDLAGMTLDISVERDWYDECHCVVCVVLNTVAGCQCV